MTSSHRPVEPNPDPSLFDLLSLLTSTNLVFFSFSNHNLSNSLTRKNLTSLSEVLYKITHTAPLKSESISLLCTVILYLSAKSDLPNI